MEKRGDISFDITIQPLPTVFTGTGPTKNFKFKQLKNEDHGFIYEVDTGNGIHYEVFEFKASAICTDFLKREYSEDTYKERYPKQNSFGKWAWTAISLERAITILNTFK